MSITTYAELQTAIANWLHRADLTAVIPDFITLAEAKFSRNLRLAAMEVRSTATLSSEYIALPDSFLEMKNLQLNTTPVSSLQYMPPEVMDIRYGGQSGQPQFYAIVGDAVQVAPAPDGSYTVEMEYYKKFATVSGTLNWLFVQHPDLYLFGSLLEAAPYLKDDKQLQRINSMYARMIEDLTKSDDRAKWSGSTLTMRAV